MPFQPKDRLHGRRGRLHVHPAVWISGQCNPTNSEQLELGERVVQEHFQDFPWYRRITSHGFQLSRHCRPRGTLEH